MASLRRFCRAALFLLLALTVVFVTGIARGADGSGKKAPIRISSWTRPFNLPVMVELERDSYDEAFPEFAVSMVDMQSGPNLMAALEAGEVDIVQGIGDAAFLVAASAGVDAKIFAVNSRSPKAFAVVSNNPGINEIKDLKGHSVAGLRGSVVHQVFLDALAENGMTEADVEFFPMPVANAASTLLAGKVDAALLVGGDISRAVQSGARVLADGEGRVRGLSFAVIRASFLREHPDVPRRFMAMRRATLSRMAENPEETMATAARETKQDAEAIALIAAMYDFDCAITSDDIASMERTKKYLTENKIMRGEAEVEKLIVQ